MITHKVLHILCIKIFHVSRNLMHFENYMYACKHQSCFLWNKKKTIFYIYISFLFSIYSPNNHLSRAFPRQLFANTKKKKLSIYFFFIFALWSIIFEHIHFLYSCFFSSYFSFIWPLSRCKIFWQVIWMMCIWLMIHIGILTDR